MKKVIIVHGWGGFPNKGWFKWLKIELKKKRFKVIIPIMPNKDQPMITKWVNHLNKISGSIDKDTYFIGHSIGCQTILRYLAKKRKTKIGGAIFVAGWFSLNNLESKEEEKIARPWIKNSINLSNIKINDTVAIFSDNDPYVELKNSEIFKKVFRAKIIVQHNKGHFEESKTKKMPLVLKEILRMSN